MPPRVRWPAQDIVRSAVMAPPGHRTRKWVGKVMDKGMDVTLLAIMLTAVFYYGIR